MRIPACSLLLLLCTAWHAENSTAQTLEWIQSTGGEADGYGSAFDVGVDNSGNVYLTGGFFLDADFDGDGINDVIDAGFGDIFLAKYNNVGELQWVIAPGGAGIDQGRGIAVDGQGNSYITGFIEADADFSGDGIPDAIHTGFSNLFLAKYNTQGMLLWVHNVCGFGEGVAVDKNNGVFVTGQIASCADFDGDGEADQSGSGPVVAKYSQDGDFEWFRFADGGISETGTGVGTDAVGNVYYTGGFFGSPDFDGDTVPDLVSTSAASVFLAKYDAAGVFQWVRAAGSTTEDARGLDISVSSEGTSFITGVFTGAADFNGDGTPDVIDNFFGKAFVARYDSAGVLGWVRSFGGVFLHEGHSVAADENAVFIAGYFDGAGDFDEDGTSDVVGAILARYSIDGLPLSVMAGSGSNPDDVRALTLDSNGDLYLAGYYTLATDIDGDSTADVSSARGSFEPFVAKFTLAEDTAIDSGLLPGGSSRLLLGQNFPNPVEFSTTIQFNVLEAARVTLSIYDLLGRRVATLVDQYLAPGEYEREWAPENRAGKTASSELLIYRLTAGSESASRAMLVLR